MLLLNLQVPVSHYNLVVGLSHQPNIYTVHSTASNFPGNTSLAIRETLSGIFHGAINSVAESQVSSHFAALYKFVFNFQCNSLKFDN
jgi:hypothetical protein